MRARRSSSRSEPALRFSFAGPYGNQHPYGHGAASIHGVETSVPLFHDVNEVAGWESALTRSPRRGRNRMARLLKRALTLGLTLATVTAATGTAAVAGPPPAT